MIVKKSNDTVQDFRQKGDQKEVFQVNHQNWVPADQVKTSFNIQHDGSSIFLRYHVREDHVRATCTEINSAVWNDSCVEFFFSFEGDDNFYNFEINAIGTVLGGYGKDRHERQWLPVELLRKITTQSSLGNEPFGDIKELTAWDITIVIPIGLFCYNEISALSGLKGTANFYKCGDGLTRPHFLSWKPVLTDTPDFHLPQFFGELVFK